MEPEGQPGVENRDRVRLAIDMRQDAAAIGIDDTRYPLDLGSTVLDFGKRREGMPPG